MEIVKSVVVLISVFGEQNATVGSLSIHIQPLENGTFNSARNPTRRGDGRRWEIMHENRLKMTAITRLSIFGSQHPHPISMTAYQR
jgi:hypothetical protein